MHCSMDSETSRAGALKSIGQTERVQAQPLAVLVILEQRALLRVGQPLGQRLALRQVVHAAVVEVGHLHLAGSGGGAAAAVRGVLAPGCGCAWLAGAGREGGTGRRPGPRRLRLRLGLCAVVRAAGSCCQCRCGQRCSKAAKRGRLGVARRWQARLLFQPSPWRPLRRAGRRRLAGPAGGRRATPGRRPACVQKFYRDAGPPRRVFWLFCLGAARHYQIIIGRNPIEPLLWLNAILIYGRCATIHSSELCEHITDRCMWRTGSVSFVGHTGTGRLRALNHSSDKRGNSVCICG